jgi:hypothetical protein
LLLTSYDRFVMAYIPPEGNPSFVWWGLRNHRLRLNE